MLKRLPWIERKFHLDIPVGWLPNVISRLEGTTIRIRYYIKSLSDLESEGRISGKWSIKEHIGHLSDLEDLHLNRVIDFEEKRDVMRPADMLNKKTEDAGHNSQSIFDLLGGFETKRRKFISTIASLDNELQIKSLLHERLNKRMKPVDMAYFTAEHDDHHIVSILDIITSMNKISA